MLLLRDPTQLLCPDSLSPEYDNARKEVVAGQTDLSDAQAAAFMKVIWANNNMDNEHTIFPLYFSHGLIADQKTP